MKPEERPRGLSRPRMHLPARNALRLGVCAWVQGELQAPPPWTLLMALPEPLAVLCRARSPCLWGLAGGADGSPLDQPGGVATPHPPPPTERDGQCPCGVSPLLPVTTAPPWSSLGRAPVPISCAFSIWAFLSTCGLQVCFSIASRVSPLLVGLSVCRAVLTGDTGLSHPSTPDSEGGSESTPRSWDAAAVQGGGRPSPGGVLERRPAGLGGQLGVPLGGQGSYPKPRCTCTHAQTRTRLWESCETHVLPRRCGWAQGSAFPTGSQVLP